MRRNIRPFTRHWRMCIVRDTKSLKRRDSLGLRPPLGITFHRRMEKANPRNSRSRLPPPPRAAPLARLKKRASLSISSFLLRFAETARFPTQRKTKGCSQRRAPPPPPFSFLLSATPTNPTEPPSPSWNGKSAFFFFRFLCSRPPQPCVPGRSHTMPEQCTLLRNARWKTVGVFIGLFFCKWSAAARH